MSGYGRFHFDQLCHCSFSK
ncbi:rCG38921, partial [Rattus norvegicus]